VRPPPATLRYLRRAFRQGRFDEVCTTGDAAGESAGADPGRAAETAELALLVGAAHAARDRLALAEDYLASGLDRWAALDGGDRDGPGGGPPPSPTPVGPSEWPEAPPSGTPPEAPPTPPEQPEAPDTGTPWKPPSPPPPPGGYPGPPPTYPPWPAPPGWSGPAWAPTPGHVATPPWAGPSMPAPAPRRHAPFTDWCSLLLSEVQVRLGRVDVAGERLTALAEPHHDPVTRFAAARGQAALATMAGDHERAHHLLNTATGLAARVPSRFRAALVERDRAVVLARSGRLTEALALADRVLVALVRPVTGAYQRWSRTEATSLALELSRHAALAGAEEPAQRLLQVATDALAPLDHPMLGAHLLLSTAVVLGSGGDALAAEADQMLSRAGAAFEASGDRSAGALVLLEHGRIAHRRGLERSARPLYHQAAAELRACGLRADAGEPAILLAALDAGRPPTPRPGR
jgi:hypothetical protein